MLKSVGEKLLQGVKFRQALALLHSPCAVQGPKSLEKSTATVNIGGLQVKALVDSGSTENFIHPISSKKQA